MAKADTSDRRDTPDLVAASVDRHRAEIAGQVLQSLRRAGSRLARDQTTKDQLRAQVNRVLDDTVALLRGGPRVGTAQRPDPASIEIGRQRARHGIHLAESIRADGAVFETALLAIAPDLRDAQDPVDCVTQFCLALQHCLARQADLIGRSYFTSLLDKIYQTNSQMRFRLSRDLHDHVAHTVVVALRDLELYDAYRMADHERAQARLTTAKVHLQEAIDAIRALSSQLRKTETSEGLQPALVRYLSGAGPSVTTAVSVTGAESDLPVAVCDELYLVLREALGNALRHAHPRTIAVEVRIGRDCVAATVTDDGRGFDSDQALVAPTGVGLLSMVERTYNAGGTLRVTSLAGRGTTVRVEIPLPRRPA